MSERHQVAASLQGIRKHLWKKESSRVLYGKWPVSYRRRSA